MRTALLLLTLTACTGDKSSGGVSAVPGLGGWWDSPAPGPAPVPRAELRLDGAATRAGDAVGYAFVVTDETGRESPLTPISIESDAEPGLAWEGATLRPVVAGEHWVRARGWDAVSGAELDALAPLLVEAGPAAAVDLVLADLEVQAGGAVGYTLRVEDAFGNAVTDADATVTGEGLTVEGGEITGTTPGLHLVVGTAAGLDDVELLRVVPAAPATVSLTLDAPSYELGETARAQVIVADTYGNPVDVRSTLAVSGVDAAIGRSTVTFTSEGDATVTATVDGTGLVAAVGPLRIDSTGPSLVLHTPDRGAWAEDGMVRVEGTAVDAVSGVSAVTVGGVVAAVDSAGDFAVDLPLGFGVHALETVAVDGDGNTSADRRAVLAAEAVPLGDAAPDALSVRIHEGAGGFGTLEALGAGLVSSTDLTALIPNPVVNRSSTSCPLGVCVTWYSVRLTVSNPSIGDVSLGLDPLATGRLAADVRVEDVRLRWRGSGKIAGVDWSETGFITADALDITTRLRPWVLVDNIRVDLVSVAATADNFDFTIDGALYQVLDFFGLASTLSSTVEGYVLDAVEDAVAAELPPRIDSALESLDVSAPLVIGATTVDLDALPAAIAVDDQGLTLRFDTAVTPRGALAIPSPASPRLGESLPAWTGSPGAVIGLSVDLLNQLLAAAWATGLLDQSVDLSDAGVSASDLALLFPTASAPVLTVEAPLPPVVAPGAGTTDFDLQLGDLHLVLWSAPPADGGTALLDAWATGAVELDLSASTADAIVPAFGAVDVGFDVVAPAAGAADAERVLEALFPLLLPGLVGALGEIPIPAIDGFVLDGVTLGTAGGSGGTLTIGGALTVAP